MENKEHDKQNIVNKNKLFCELVDGFMRYQYRLENPYPNVLTNENEAMKNKYMTDQIFNAKVQQLARGVMAIVDKHI